ncbi:MAG: regulator, partial [Planctomycetota bacterium]|nr:regulator [Planctomycetota bacterium]MCZ6688315.1 regulator [Planctomycetota bacterium]
YVEGLHIVDISDPSNITKVANFDTYTCGTCRDSDGFAGAWGVYPFTRPYVYVSDLNSGLYIFTF